jgi:hypothetical protein
MEREQNTACLLVHTSFAFYGEVWLYSCFPCILPPGPRLHRAGYKVEQIILMGWGVSIVLSLIGIVGYRLGVHDGIMFTGFMTLYFFYHWMVSRALINNQIFNRQLQPQIDE